MWRSIRQCRVDTIPIGSYLGILFFLSFISINCFCFDCICLACTLFQSGNGCFLHFLIFLSLEFLHLTCSNSIDASQFFPIRDFGFCKNKFLNGLDFILFIKKKKSFFSIKRRNQSCMQCNPTRSQKMHYVMDCLSS